MMHAADKKEAFKLRQALTKLTASVRSSVKAVDALMGQPHTRERDGKVAKLMNELEMANDRVRFFVLGEDWRKST